MDSDGNLSIDCKIYGSIEDAKAAQADLNNRDIPLSLQLLGCPRAKLNVFH